ncbi:chorismate mutase [Vannielia litorea]|uniref:chorismate mutase n=1 Tax=Vannielia litorea TaxID=1217970 RepID=A0A1N6EA94_9RHOB|nr:chorismate mutase [Vannielia litorea]SIN79916.1 isochorismate pyruvate lyase [Vannielia litorea]
MRRNPGEIGTIAEMRAQIDEIDAELVALLAERQAHVDCVPALKRAAGISAAAPSRSEAVLAHVTELAERKGFAPELARILWREMIAFYVAREQEHLGIGGEDL